MTPQQPQPEPPEDEVHRLEANLRLLAQRVGWLEGRNGALEAENSRLRWAMQAGEGPTGEDPRERALRIVRAAEERASQISAEAARAADAQISMIEARIAGLERTARRRSQEFAARIPEPGRERPANQAEVNAAREQVHELLAMREALIEGIRGSLLGFASELQRAERWKAPPLPAPRPEPPPPPGNGQITANGSRPEAHVVEHWLPEGTQPDGPTRRPTPRPTAYPGVDAAR